jgi:hypothetical protein
LRIGVNQWASAEKDKARKTQEDTSNCRLPAVLCKLHKPQLRSEEEKKEKR